MKSKNIVHRLKNKKLKNSQAIKIIIITLILVSIASFFIISKIKNNSLNALDNENNIQDNLNESNTKAPNIDSNLNSPTFRINQGIMIYGESGLGEIIDNLNVTAIDKSDLPKEQKYVYDSISSKGTFLHSNKIIWISEPVETNKKLKDSKHILYVSYNLTDAQRKIADNETIGVIILYNKTAEFMPAALALEKDTATFFTKETGYFNIVVKK